MNIMKKQTNLGDLLPVERGDAGLGLAATTPPPTVHGGGCCCCTGVALPTAATGGEHLPSNKDKGGVVDPDPDQGSQTNADSCGSGSWLDFKGTKKVKFYFT
jgi:hypothetical protein